MTSDEEELQRELARIEEQVQQLKDRQSYGAIDYEGQGKLIADLDQIIPKLDVRTEKNGAVFYDNGQSFDEKGEIVTNQQRANRFCNEPGNEHCQTLEQTPSGAWLEKQNLFDNCLQVEDARRIWGDVSEQYARQAQGETHAFVELNSAEHRTWAFREKQTLRDDSEATYINNHYQLAPGYEIVQQENLARSIQRENNQQTQENSMPTEDYEQNDDKQKKDEFTVEIDGQERTVSEKEGVVEIEGVESEEELERLMKENPELAEAVNNLREDEELEIEIEEEKEIEQERQQEKTPEKEQESVEVSKDRDKDRNR